MTTKAPSISDFLNSEEDHSPEGYLSVGEVLISPEAGDDPTGMSVSDLRFKGYVKVWDTLTGAISLQPRYLLWQTLKKRRDDGSLVFTLNDPGIPPNYGEDLKCPLHVDSPEYKVYQQRGFRSCKRQHVPNQAALDAHVRSSHKRAFVAMKELRAEAERQEGLALQREAIETNRQLMNALGGAVTRDTGLKHNHGAPWNVKHEGCPRCEAE